MRRKEFSVEEQEIITFLDQCSFGFLGTVSPDGEPRVTPLNFCIYGWLLLFSWKFSR